MDELDTLKRQLEQAVATVHNMVVANQAAWIEWQYGAGAESAMERIHNGLVGPGHIPLGTQSVDPDDYQYQNSVEYPTLPQQTRIGE